MFIDRKLQLEPDKSILLLGPRRVGKSTYLKENFGDAHWVDLLKTDVFFDYRSRPALLRERYGATKERQVIVVDEIQLIPELIREVHWMVENTKSRFILSGSSARKLRKEGVTNLAGRLRTRHLFPLVASEIPKFNLEERLQYGCLPSIVLSKNPKLDLKDYCGEYLREEIQSEGHVRNLPAFSRFLELSALSNGELLSFSTIARDCGVAQKTIKEYFQILVDTLIGYYLDPYIKVRKRRAILAPKFYFFDCGLPNTLLGRELSRKTPEYGKAFEQLMVLETIAAKEYGQKMDKLTYWRSASGYEVDLIIDSHTAVEFKTGAIHSQDAKSLLKFGEEVKLKNKWLVGLEAIPRKLDNGVWILPWKEYLNRIHEGKW